MDDIPIIDIVAPEEKRVPLMHRFQRQPKPEKPQREATVIHINSAQQQKRGFIVPTRCPFPVLLEDLADNTLYTVTRRYMETGCKVFVARGYQLKAGWENMSLARYAPLNDHKLLQRSDDSTRRSGGLRVLLPNGQEIIVHRVRARWADKTQAELNEICGWEEVV